LQGKFSNTSHKFFHRLESERSKNSERKSKAINSKKKTIRETTCGGSQADYQHQKLCSPKYRILLKQEINEPFATR